MNISILLLTHRGTEPLLLACLESLDAAGAQGRVQVLVGYNGSWPADAPALERLQALFPWARFVPLENAARGAARNRLVPLASGQVIHFLDDDTTVPPDFLSRLEAAYARHPEAPAMGGPNVGPARAGAFERAVDFLLRSPLGAGPMRVRYARAGRAGPRPGWCFMLSNLGARREVFTRERMGFPEDCVSAEENLFLFEVERRLGPAVYDPGLYVHHRRRPDLTSFCRQVACNGAGRAHITRARAATLQPVVLAPAAAAGALIALAAAKLWTALAACLLIYAGAALIETIRLAWSEGDAEAAVRLPALFAAAHGSYLWGFCRGLLEGRAPSPRPVARTADA